MTSTNRYPGLTMGLGVALLAMAALGRFTVSAGAQCEEPPPSSCSSCHALEHPISTEGDWHQIHCRQDLCLNCHGGNGSTMDKVLAHQDMNAQPLSDIYTDCHSCHPDYNQRADRFTVAVGITPGSCATPTPAVLSVSASEPRLGSPDVNVLRTQAPPASAWAGLTAAGLALMAFFLFSIIWIDRHSIWKGQL